MKPGGGDLVIKVPTISSCNNQTNLETSSISFGDSLEGSVCGQTQTSEVTTSEFAETKSKLSSLFHKMGAKGSQNGNANSGSSGKSVCPNNGNSGVLITSEGEGEFLGLCDNTSSSIKNSEKSSFLDIKKTSSKVEKIQLCGNNCGSDENNQALQQLSNKKNENGKEIQFYKNTTSS